ncbi:MAG: hypothetical protein DYH06_09580, partial [Acidobacteria bacterium ACB2]|nr:hypothetical protein [Acidobacteria bacterium ACB2]
STRRRIARAVLAALVLLAGAGATIVTAPWRGRTVARIASAGTAGIRALDEDGKVLWERDDVPESGFCALVHVRGLSRQRVVALRHSPGARPAGPEGALLSFLSPSTGAVEREIRLAAPHAEAFAGEPARFSPAEVRALDLDDDGADEVLATFVHYNSAPSYVVLYEPAREESRLVFLGTGYHYVSGAADLDGDGRKEVVLHGTANGLGWYSAVAAVPAASLPEQERRSARADNPPVCSPDLPPSSGTETRSWYTLVGPPYGDAAQRSTARLDTSGGRLVLDGDERWEFTLDGFRVRATSAPPPNGRGEKRRTAYQELRAAGIAARTETWPDGLRHAREAAAAASGAGEALLAEWARRVEAGLLVRSGAVEDGVARFEELMRTTEVPALVAFDAGRALHRAGELRPAVDWYVRLAGGAGTGTGRNPWEALEGAVLALAETGRFDEAARVVVRFRGAFGEGAPHASMYAAFVDWKRGLAPGPERFESESALDLHRYWQLEARLARGESATALLSTLDAVDDPSNALGELRRLLRAELRMRAGAPAAEVLDSARAALTALRGARTQEPIARAHLDVATARFARIAEAAGTRDEVKETRAFLARVWGKSERAIRRQAS